MFRILAALALFAAILLTARWSLSQALANVECDSEQYAAHKTVCDLKGWLGLLLRGAGLWILLAAALSALLLTTLLLVALQFLYYNIEFQQWQGRYLFPALIPIALTLVYGLDHWRARRLSRWESLHWLTPLALASLLALDIYLLFRVVVPGLS